MSLLPPLRQDDLFHPVWREGGREEEKEEEEGKEGEEGRRNEEVGCVWPKTPQVMLYPLTTMPCLIPQDNTSTQLDKL